MHVAIIMDGNGRWAQQRGLLRSVGHHAGARTVRRIVEAAVRSSIDVLTLYAFSSDNWSRPRVEVHNLMTLFRRYLQSEVVRCVENGVRVRVVGRRDRLHKDLIRIIEQAEHVTAGCNRMLLQLAVDYSARDAIARAALTAAREGIDDALGSSSELATTDDGRAPRDAIRAFGERIADAIGAPVGDSNNVDLLIRTGGERRLSDFLLWECAYAELVFVDAYWPDFDEQAFAAALAEYKRRERRFGGLPAGPADRSLAEIS
jgi:undecaprenyl diphosphate synthase